MLFSDLLNPSIYEVSRMWYNSSKVCIAIKLRNLSAVHLRVSPPLRRT